MKRIEGYAIVFAPEISCDLGGFREEIHPKALTGVCERSDILCTVDHDTSRGVLARATKGKGTLSLSVDNRGLKYSLTPPSSAAAVIESVERGDLRGSSFIFTLPATGADSFRKLSNGTILRTIYKFDELRDVSLVYHPAYPGTEVKVI